MEGITKIQIHAVVSNKNTNLLKVMNYADIQFTHEIQLLKEVQLKP
jgi:hypothetical protein